MNWLRQIGSIIRACGWVALFLAAPLLPAQEVEPPYRVPVQGDQAVVHAGPGSTHYGTDRLPPGTLVDVYRHDPGGWMAIRPPDGSFSLLQRDEVELLPDGLARIRFDDTVAWVGTRLTPVENPMWQIRLKKDEVVSVLGIVDRKKFELGSEDPDWVQIMPPAGEFRWIAASELDLEKQRPLKSARRSDAVATNQTSPDPRTTNPDGGPIPGDVHLAPPPREMTRNRQSPSQQDSWNIEVESPTPGDDWSEYPSLDTDVSPSPARPETGTTGWQPARQTIANFVSERSDFAAESSAANPPVPVWNQAVNRDGEVAHIRAGIFDATDNRGISIPGTVSTISAAAGSSLAALELRLSQEMLKAPVDWNLQGLARDVQQFRGTAVDAVQQQSADQLLEKIRQCREIQAGYQATDGPGPDDLFTSRPGGYQAPANPASTLQAAQVVGGSTPELLHNYDAFGWLNELVRDGGTGPSTYVLQDEQGRITHHITAPPGLNLRRYLNQRVGIIGNRGFNQQLNLQHVTAERVIAVESLRR